MVSGTWDDEDERGYANDNGRTGDTQQGTAQETQDELMNLMTIMYITLQETLNDPEDMSSSYGILCKL